MIEGGREMKECPSQQCCTLPRKAEEEPELVKKMEAQGGVVPGHDPVSPTLELIGHLLEKQQQQQAQQVSVDEN